jgi:Ribosomal RNA adenine dimethylase
VSARRSRSARDARRRSHGQNFLANRTLAERIVGGAGVRASDLVLEIGAGSGVLTDALARTGAKALLRMLLDDPRTPLRRAELVVQWEVARKRAGRPRSLVSASWSPWFRLRLGGKVARQAFRPGSGRRRRGARRRAAIAAAPAAGGARAISCVRGGVLLGLARDLDAVQWSALFEAYRAARGEASSRSGQRT